jgi:hypothetical protein
MHLLSNPGLAAARMEPIVDPRFNQMFVGTAPVHGDEGEQTVLDLVPLAGAWRQVSQCDLQAGLIGEALEFASP